MACPRVHVPDVRPVAAESNDIHSSCSDGNPGATAVQPAIDADALRKELAALNAELDALQGETPMIREIEKEREAPLDDYDRVPPPVERVVYRIRI